jgi:hypothetical protein
MIEPRIVASRRSVARPVNPTEPKGGRETILCEIGLTRLFGVGDIDRTGLVSGWAQPEDSHNWNEGLDATLVLSCEQASEPLHVIFQGEPHLPPGVGAQDITLFANGYFAAHWRARPQLHEDASLAATIEPDWWVLRDGSPSLSLVLHIPGSMSPRDAGTGMDNRILGFCFRTLTLRRDD